jgi:hypothetical protein
MNDHRLIFAPVAVLCVLVGALVLSAAPALAVEGECPNEQLRAEQPYGLELPDCRAYEMVSPLDKNDSNAAQAGQISSEYDRASASGEAITYDSFGSFPGAEDSRFVSQYLSRRGPADWSTKGITPPFSILNKTNILSAYESLIFTPDLSAGVAETDVPLTSDALPEDYNFYVHDFADGSYQLVTSGGLAGSGGYSGGEIYIYGASTDLSHIVFSFDSRSIYEWVDGRLSQVNIAPNGTEMAVSVPYAGITTLWRGVSDDGLRVVMSSEPEHQLYVRENPEQPQSPLSGEECTVSSDACTVEVSASQLTVPDPNGPQAAEYAGASAEGSRVFFTSKAELTEDAKTGPADNAENLYEYDLDKPAGERLTDLTVDTNAGDVDGAGVLGIVDISEDGSYVYFVAEGELAARAVSGQPNLYLEHEGAITLVATLSSVGDNTDWSHPVNRIPSTVGINTIRETPDGTHLAFLSTRSLTGYNNEQATTGECEGAGACREVFSYDATSGTLVCASCNPSGARPVGPSSFGNEGSNEDVARDDYTQRNFSEDGSRLFFQTDDALVAQDSNGRENVYEYEDGRVYPISYVAGGYDSYFVDASASGDDVFIATDDQLLPQDTDFLLDVYDARVDGGFPVPVSASPCDNADSCEGPVSPQPSVFEAPASATFSGAGNVIPPPPAVVKPKQSKPAKCKKGLVKKHRKCVKKKAKKFSNRSKKARK